MTDGVPPLPPGGAPLPSGGGSLPPSPPGEPGGAEVREQLARLEHLLERAVSGAPTARPGEAGPAWRRETAGEARWPASLAILAALVLQMSLPDRLNLSSRYLLPSIEAALLVAILAVNPRRVDRLGRPLRILGLTLIIVATVANAYSAFTLILGLVRGTDGDAAGPLLASGAAVYVTNILVFALWYWESDRGGPAVRAHALVKYPDFLFPQIATPDVASNEWEPYFVDYLFLSFTNATAFSPTDTLPLTRWAKLAMLMQSAVSLVTVALVIARSVNILK